MQGAMGHASFFDTLKTVLSAFAGIRRKSEHEKLALNPLHVAIMAVSALIVFIVALVTIVKIVTS